MANKREWITLVMAGTFLISAVTGVLMFFHVDTGLNKVAHTWLSWVFLGAVALHLAMNYAGIKKCLRTRGGKLLIGLFGLTLLLSFLPAGAKTKSNPPFVPCVKALAHAPLTTLASVAQVSPDALRKRLLQAGIPPRSDQQSLQDLVGQDLRKQMQILGMLLANGK